MRPRWRLAVGAALFCAGAAGGAWAWRCCTVKGDVPAAREPKRARPAAEIVREFKSVHTPGFGNELSEDEFERTLRAALERQNRLALELFEADPQDSNASELLFVRWSNLTNGMQREDDVVAETTRILDGESPGSVSAVAGRARAQAAIHSSRVDTARAAAWLEEAVAAQPNDAEMNGALLELFAELRTADPARQRELVTRAARVYGPRGRQGKSEEEWGLLPLLARLGTPLILEFDDALGSGTWHREVGHPLIVHCWSAGRWDIKTTERDPDVDDIRRALAGLRAAGVGVVAVDSLGRANGRVDAVAGARARAVTWPYAVETTRSNLDLFAAGGYSSFLWVDAEGRVTAWCRKLAPLLEYAGLPRR
jgi:hypothetical protein